MWKKFKPYVISILLPLAIGGLSALLTMNNMEIYSKIETPTLTKECFDKLSQLIQDMGTVGMEEAILHITCNGSCSEDIVSQGTNMLVQLIQNFIPKVCVLCGISTKESDEGSFTILLLAGYTQK